MSKNEADASDGFVAATAGLWLVAFVASVIIWLIWQYRAQANARALTEGGTEFSPMGRRVVVRSVRRPRQTVPDGPRALEGERRGDRLESGRDVAGDRVVVGLVARVQHLGCIRAMTIRAISAG
jgi:hypothetical protein